MKTFHIKVTQPTLFDGQIVSPDQILAIIHTDLPINELAMQLGFKTLVAVGVGEPEEVSQSTSQENDASWYDEHDETIPENSTGGEDSVSESAQPNAISSLPPTVRASLEKNGIVTPEDAYEYLIVNENFSGLNLSAKSEQALTEIANQFKSTLPAEA